jgi:hypothetical protein
MFITCANAECTAPDVYELGTGINLSGLCTSISTGATAASTAEIAVTSEKSFLVQADTYAKQALATQNMIIQTEMMIRDLEENPLQVITPDANQLIANQKRISSLATDIANNSSNIGDNLMNNIKHPNTIGLGQGSRFALWSEARRKAVEESYAINKQFVADAARKDKSIWDAIKNISATKDKTATMKATANAAGQQLSWLQSIGETLNQLMGAQAVESGMKIEMEIQALENANSMIDNPPGKNIRVEDDKEYSKYSGTTGF